MKQKFFNSEFFTVIYLIIFAALTRLVPHPWNATAIGALALFSGREMRSKVLSFLIPMAALLLTDLALGFHSTMPFVYGAILLTVWIGQGLPRGAGAVARASLLSSIAFFFITNFGFWLAEDLYPHTGVGLIECLIAGWPFFRAQIFGDLVYALAIFGGFAVVKKIAVQERVSL